MYHWLVARLIRWQLHRALAQGKVEMTLRLRDERTEFVFPGRNSFAGTFHGRAQIEAWLRRFLSLHPEYRVRDVMVAGPPWNTRVAARFSDRIGDHYRNEGVEHIVTSWGRIRSFRVFLDTEAISRWEQDHPQEAGLVGRAVAESRPAAGVR